MVRRKTHASPQQELRQEHEKVAARKGECEREQDALGILEINLKTARELCDSIRGAERKISSLLAASELSTMTTRRRSLSQGGLSVADRLPAVEPNNVQNRRSRRSTMIAVLPTKNSAAKVVASEKGYRSVSPIKRLNNNTNDLFSYREIEQLEDGSFVESDSNASKSPSPATPIRQRSASTSSSSDVSNLAVQFQNLSIFKRDGDVANEGFLSSNAQRSSGMIPMAQNLSVTSKQNSNRKSTSAAEAPKFMCITKYMSLRTKLVPFVREVTQEELESQGGKNVRWQSPLVHASLSSAGRVPKSSHHGAAFLSANSSLSSLQKSNKSKSAQNSQHSHLFPCQRTSVNDISDEETMNLLKKPKWSRPQATLSGGSEDETGRLRRRSVNVFVHSGSNKARSSSPPPLTRRRLASASSSSSVVSSSQSGLQANKTKRRTTSRDSRTDAGETDDENANPLGGHGRKSRYNLRSLSSRRSLANDDVTQELTKLQKNVRHIKSQAASSEGSEDESTRLRRRSTRAIARTGSNVTRSSSPPALTRRRMASASSSSSVVSSSQSGQQAKKIKHRTTSKGVESEVDVKTRDGNNRKSARRSSRRLTMMK